MHVAFKGLFENMSVARKLFRLFKSLNEYQTIKGYLTGGKAMENILPIAARLAFLFYWLFDNLAVLIKINFIKGYDLKAMSRRAAKCWLTGILLSIVIAVKAMI